MENKTTRNEKYVNVIIIKASHESRLKTIILTLMLLLQLVVVS
jgi:hypothetical protein